ncbi:DGAT1/2-independent enzyme synthesizing storage lipids-like isoform X1 [Haliotis cracherodii]|uniref:DGAT1/2-independent enzyme synthesizing storage lipids-like isoform X1 n=1 Tax=Haliotis cracherodii TaxID=6455 RepID=UPI0039E8A40A
MYNLTVCVDYILQQVGQLDIDYLRWVVWLTYPIIISFLLPLILLVFLYASVLFLLVYRQRHRLRDAYAHDFWDGARKTLAALWDGQGRIWHGYEVVGLHEIPDSGPALVIYYHGVIPIDVYYIMAKVILEKGRQIRAVGDRFLFHIPGWRLLMEVFHVTPGTVQSCVDVLKAGHILTISPGGVREALFGDEYYHVMWAKRTGFAKVALQANVPVIPMFTMNSREAFRTPGWGRSLLRKFYEITRLPLVPIYGFFPVKLRTYLGKPLYPSSDDTPETFASKVQRAVEALVKRHQQVPGSVVKALLDRMPWKIKKS